MTAPLPPIALFVTQTPSLQRTTLIGIIEHVIAGRVDIAVVAQWALRSFHDMVQDDSDDDDDDIDIDVDITDDDDDDEQDTAVDQAIMDALDALMFADQAAFAPDTAQLQHLIRQLQS
jgi:hypothetical protein